jgi:DNA-binding transcriptional LysR family regulator
VVGSGGRTRGFADRAAAHPGFAIKLHQLDLWLQDLITQDSDAALYLMFQRASSTTVGYSPSHAVVCAGLCHILAKELELPQSERDTLIRPL